MGNKKAFEKKYGKGTLSQSQLEAKGVSATESPYGFAMEYPYAPHHSVTRGGRQPNLKF